MEKNSHLKIKSELNDKTNNKNSYYMFVLKSNNTKK